MLSCELAELACRVAVLESAEDELGEVRATLLVNFGDVPRNRYGFTIANEGRTLTMLVRVLEQLTQKGAVHEPPPEDPREAAG